MEKPLSPENVEARIERFLNELDNYALDQFPEDIQDRLAYEWYDAEMKAQVGKDREQAVERLNQFVEKLSKLPKKE